MSLVRAAAKGLFVAVDLLLPTRRGPRVLIYHCVGLNTGRQMEVSVDDFEWQMKWLAEHREVVSLDTALERWYEPDSDRLVVLTFDDGYRSVHQNAFPTLTALRFPFVIYLSTGLLERGRDDSDVAAVEWRSVLQMLESGLLTVGSHTHNHSDLRHLDSHAIEEELRISDGLIAERLGVRVEHFAYPWGYWSPEGDRIVRSRYATAALGSPGMRSSTSHDQHLMHRFPIQLSDGRLWFSGRLKRGLVMEEEVRRRLRGYAGP
ncbi:MAG: polysaccharide deacetylase family protein [Acidimicrobiia bacterium]|nr:polysaccharide deacetylase family protein [Acidimicrobiia bacterium]